jgi:AraC family transcriptional regulator of adaptative response / DNA-3-methyladenine glycosylase II
MDDGHRIAELIVRRIEEGVIDGGAKLEDIAEQFEVSSRQLRRIVQKELGVSPIDLIQTRRLLMAKQLLTETTLPVTEIAFASGFASLRRFNDAFVGRYKLPPSKLRRAAADTTKIAARDASTIRLGYRPPYHWPGILNFLARRALKDIECVSGQTYCRTIQLGGHKGWVRVSDAPDRHALKIEFANALTPVLPALIGRLRNLFDLSARPDIIAKCLMEDRTLSRAVAAHRGLRVPGAFDGFELAFRAVLGQQVSVKTATTLAARLTSAYGEEIETPIAELRRLSPRPERLAGADADEISSLGIVGTRADTILALAQAVASGRLNLEAGVHPERMIERLTAIAGIGQWTAHYIAMRALRWTDAFPRDDLILRKNLGGVSAREAEEMSQAWRPWRSYAVLHIWNSVAQAV